MSNVISYEQAKREDADASINFRSSWFHVVVYPENEDGVKALEAMSDDCAYILHNKDQKHNGEDAKPHYHAIFHFKNARFRFSLASALHVEARFVRHNTFCENGLLYLVHADKQSIAKHKKPYSIDEVSGALRESLQVLLGKSNLDECSVALAVLDYIESQDSIISFKSFLRFIASNRYYGHVVRGFSIYKECILEQNDSIRMRVPWVESASDTPDEWIDPFYVPNVPQLNIFGDYEELVDGHYPYKGTNVKDYPCRDAWKDALAYQHEKDFSKYEPKQHGE